MANFEDFYDFIVPSCRGIDLPIVDFEIRKAVRDWQRSTTMWREIVPLTLLQGVTDYRIVPANGGITAGIYSLPDPQRPDGFLREMAEVARYPEGYLPAPGPPDGYWQLYPGLIRLNRGPDQSYPITVGIYKQMSQDASDDYIPDDLFDQYADKVASGALAQLLAQPGKPWRDLNMATWHNTSFTKAKLALRAKLRKGGSHGQARVTAPFFAGRIRG
jgi:hypothetical protein